MAIVCVTHFTGVNIFDMQTIAPPGDEKYPPAPYYCCVSQATVQLGAAEGGGGGGLKYLRKRVSDKSHLAPDLL